MGANALACELSPAKLAALLGIARETIRTRIRNKELPARHAYKDKRHTIVWFDGVAFVLVSVAGGEFFIADAGAYGFAGDAQERCEFGGREFTSECVRSHSFPPCSRIIRLSARACKQL